MPIYEKIQRIREDSLKLDWTPDKEFPKAGKMIPFVSGEKIKKQFAPLWAKHKVDFGVDVVSATSLNIPGKGYDITYEVTVQFILTDTEDGTQDISTVRGFAGANDLHAPKTAIAYAYNTYMTNKFQIVDGIEDAEESTEKDIVGRLTAMAVPESTETPVKTEKPIEKVSIPTPNTESPAKARETPNASLSVSERKAADKAFEQIVQFYEDGSIVETEYQKVKEIYDGLSSTADVHILMGMVRQIKADMNKGKEGGF